MISDRTRSHRRQLVYQGGEEGEPGRRRRRRRSSSSSSSSSGDSTTTNNNNNNDNDNDNDTNTSTTSHTPPSSSPVPPARLVGRRRCQLRSRSHRRGEVDSRKEAILEVDVGVLDASQPQVQSALPVEEASLEAQAGAGVEADSFSAGNASQLLHITRPSSAGMLGW